MRQVPAELAELYRVHFCPDRQREFISFMMYARDNGILQGQITIAARRLRNRGVRHLTADHLRVELDSMLNADRHDAGLMQYPDLSIQIPSQNQHSDIERCATSTLDALTAAMQGQSTLNAYINHN